jgi:hypothetical protein
MPTRRETLARYRYVRNYQSYSEGVLVTNPKYTELYNYTDFVEKAGALPHYRKLIATGQCATTSLWGVRYELQKRDGFVSYLQERNNNELNPANYPNLEYVSSGPICYLAPPAAGAMPRNTSYVRASNQALKKYYEHIAQVESSFKGMVFTGELRESLHMIKSPAASLRKGVGAYLTHLKRYGKRIPFKRRPKFVRDTWLEYSFGWKPLINDVDSAIKAFYSSDLVRPILQMVSGKGQDVYSQDNGHFTGSNGPSNWTYGLRHQEEFFVRYYGVYQSTGQGVPDNHHYGFRPSEIIPTVWELIPYSFLVDYFTNIGAIISSWSYRFLAGPWTSQLQRVTHHYETYDEKLVAPPPNTVIWKYRHTGDPGHTEFKRTEVYRVPNVGQPVPSFEVQCPGMGSTKWLNILALSKQLDETRRVLS